MPARNLTPRYATPSVTDPYYGDYSALAQQYLSGRNHPVFSAGQGIADVLGDVGQAYFEKQALAKAKDQETQDYSNYNMASQLAGAPNLVTPPGGTPQPAAGAIGMTGGRMGDQGAAPYFETAGTPVSTTQERYSNAIKALANVNPRVAATMGPNIQAAAQAATPQGFSGTLKNNETAYINNAPVARGPTMPESPLAKAAADHAAGLITDQEYAAVKSKETHVADGPEKYRPMTEAELKAWNLPPGTVASISSSGKPDIVNKAAPGSFLTDMGIAPDAPPDEIRATLGKTQMGANLVRQADAVLRGDEEIQKISARSGETQGNQLRSVVYALEPGYSPLIGQQRHQVNTELNNLSDRAMGGKIASANKIVDHATNLLDNAIDLKNDSMFGNFGNMVGNAVVGNAPGSTQKTNLRAFTNNKDLLGTESAKFMGGGVASDAARSEVDKSYNANDDLSGTIGAIGSTVQLMRGQLQPMVDRYNQAFGTHLDITDPKFMSPESANRLKFLENTLTAAKAGMPIDPMKLKAQLAAVKPTGATTSAAQPNADVDALLNKYAPR